MLLREVALDIFDPKDGFGAVPNNQDVSYFGFVVYMKPTTFLSLVKPLRREQAGSVDQIKEMLNQGKRMGPPFLMVSFSDERPDVPGEIVGHEGRNRMYAIMELYGDHDVPVHIFMTGYMRARHLTPQHIEFMNQVLVNERGNTVNGPFWSKAVHQP